LSWDPGQYLKFAGVRFRPAIDLLNRVPQLAPKLVYDLGCGAGNVTRALVERWPSATVIGVDGDSNMLANARTAIPGARFDQGDLANWVPESPPDVIYSNAALHWLDGHTSLFPRLMAALAPGGTLAVQMPRNHQAPSHTSMEDAAAAGPWHATLKPLLRTRPTAPPEFYYDALVPHTATLDIWEQVYLQVMEGDNPVVQFTKGSALKPLLDALHGPHRQGFERDYADRVRAAYPPRADGRTLFPFRRLFIVAQKA
jgi:trans-aconitate 2-methyltransferase